MADTIVITTDDLKAISGSTPDTVIYLLQCSDSSCTDGSIVASDDDGNAATSNTGNGGSWWYLDSFLSVTAPATATYMVIVVDYNSGREGTADTLVTVNGVDVVNTNDAVFGGWHVRAKELRVGDFLLVGKNSNTPPTGPMAANYHDSKLLVFSTLIVDCDPQSGGCGSFQFNDDVGWTTDGTLLSRIKVNGAASSLSRIVVGVYDGGSLPAFEMNARLLHVRRNTNVGGLWTDAGTVDADQDGLTLELEEQLHTCDSYSTGGEDLGWIGGRCDSVRATVNNIVGTINAPCNGNANDPVACWRPQDSDNDGFDDGWEVWAVALSCTKAPSEPLNDAGTCTAIDILAPGVCTGVFCVAGSVSAMSKPDPTVHDIYWQADAIGCAPANSATCQANHPTGLRTDHLFSPAQLDQVQKFWVDEPGSCWDGTTTSTCSIANDLRYKFAMHVEGSTVWNLPDDRRGAEISGGWALAVSYYNRQFTGFLRHGSLAHYSFSTHDDGTVGQTIGNANISIAAGDITGVDVTDRDQVVDPMFHEIGHQFLGGYHHYGQGGSAACAAGCGTSCAAMQIFCNPACKNNGVTPCADVFQHEFNTPSLMSYQYQSYNGMLAKSPTAPTKNTAQLAGCAARNNRFSKGINAPVDEGSVNETMALTPANIKLAQDLFCYDGWNDNINISPYSFVTAPLLCSTNNNNSNNSHNTGNAEGPYCSTSGGNIGCFFNWDSDTNPTPSTANYSFDINRDDSDGNGICNDDLVDDRDEWGEIFAHGKTRRKRKPIQASFQIYADTFNSGASCNWGGWPLQLTLTATLDRNVTYPTNACRADSECSGSNTCIFDQCDPGLGNPADACVAPANGCVGGICGCFNDGNCRSGVCLSNGVCATSWGVCPCSGGACTSTQSGGTCSGNGAGVVCDSDTPTSSRSEGNDPARESARFDGVDDVIRIVHSGSTSPLTAVGYRGSFEFAAEVRFDGFAAGETEHVIFSASGMKLVILPATGSTHELRATVDGSTLNSSLTIGLWHRIRWAASRTSDEHVLSVDQWSVYTGWYGTFTCIVESSFTGDVAIDGDVWIGFDGGSDNNRHFAGRMDNTQLSSRWAALDGKVPANCVEN